MLCTVCLLYTSRVDVGSNVFYLRYIVQCLGKFLFGGSISAWHHDSVTVAFAVYFFYIGSVASELCRIIVYMRGAVIKRIGIRCEICRYYEMCIRDRGYVMLKKNFVTLVLSTIGGILFAMGMCMCMLPEWNAFLSLIHI